MKIKDYHFHLYYDVKDIETASRLRDKISETFEVEVGRLWDKPVGPHPIGSCQVTVSSELFQEVMVWLLSNRDGIDFFIHPNTGDNLADHSDYIMWIGKSYELNLDGFRKA